MLCVGIVMEYERRKHSNGQCKSKGVFMIMMTPFGSHLYGLNTATSDRDFKGIFMPEARDILLGTIPKTQKLSSGPSHERNSQEDVDSETYSLHHFVQLALQGQTVALDMLHGNMETETSPEWKFLKRNRHLFYTKNMRAFIGYARKQAAKYGIKGSRLDAVREALAYLITKGDTPLHYLDRHHELWTNEHCRVDYEESEYGDAIDQQRSFWEVCGKKMTFGGKASHYVPMLKKFYENYGHRAHLAANNEGVDWKAVSHALRVGYQTQQIFKHGTFSYPLPQTPFLMKVKTGQLKYEYVAGVLDDMMGHLNNRAEASDLPDKPNVKFWEDWLEDVTLSHVLNEGA